VAEGGAQVLGEAEDEYGWFIAPEGNKIGRREAKEHQE
jgi:hypothetical protein